jgi:non-homologous end joining protein Ku
MAPRAYWKGYLKLSLVSCPIALYPATRRRVRNGVHWLKTPIRPNVGFGSLACCGG